MKNKVYKKIVTGIFFLISSNLFTQSKDIELIKPTIEINQHFADGAFNYVLTSDDKYVVTYAYSNFLKVYSTKTGKLVKTLFGHYNLVNGLTVNPKTGIMISTDISGKVIEWDEKLNIKKQYLKKEFKQDFNWFAETHQRHNTDYPIITFNKSFNEINYKESDGSFLETSIPISEYDYENEFWLGQLEQLGEPVDGIQRFGYNPACFHLLNSESIASKKYLKLKYNPLKNKTWEYHRIWLSNKTNHFFIGESYNSNTKIKYKLTTRREFMPYVGIKKIYGNDSLCFTITDTSSFTFISGSVFEPVFAIRKKEKLYYLPLHNLDVKSILIRESKDWYRSTPFIDTTTKTVSWDNQTYDFSNQKHYIDSSGIEVPNFLISQQIKRGVFKEGDFWESVHEGFLKDWSKNKIVKDYHYLAIDAGVSNLIGTPIEEYYQKGITIPLISENEFVSPDMNGHLVLFDYPSEKIKKKFNAQGISIQIGIVPHTSLFFSQNTEGNVYFYDKKSKSNSSNVAALYVTSNGLCLINDQNYYFAFGKLNNDIFFNLNNEVFPFEQFDLKYNRPDLILQTMQCKDRSLITSYKNAYLKRLKRMGFTEDMLKEDFHLPEINIKNFESLPSILDSTGLELDLDINDSKYKLDRINIFINDVPVYGSAGIDLRKENTQSVKKKISLQLSEGQNKIQVSVLNQAGAESYKETAYVTYKPKQSKKPDLYLVTIGDSKYADSRFDLTYAAKDAEDIKKTFEGNSTYSNVFAYSYTNEKVTRDNILKLKNELKKAKRDDVVIITVAGHGVLDKNLDYYLATYDMDFNNPSGKGIPYEELESLVDGIAPLKKVIFLDACHSGEVDKEEVEQLAVNTSSSGNVKFRAAGAGIQKKNLGLKTTSELMSELFTDLRKGTGATVISSAGGAEYAMESDQWKNGLFTYCLLHGLKDKAADTNGDGQIMLSELQQYLRTEVTTLSNGAQQPTSRIENLTMDFRVW